MAGFELLTPGSYYCAMSGQRYPSRRAALRARSGLSDTARPYEQEPAVATLLVRRTGHGQWCWLELWVRKAVVAAYPAGSRLLVPELLMLDTACGSTGHFCGAHWMLSLSRRADGGLDRVLSERVPADADGDGPDPGSDRFGRDTTAGQLREALGLRSLGSRHCLRTDGTETARRGLPVYLGLLAILLLAVVTQYARQSALSARQTALEDRYQELYGLASDWAAWKRGQAPLADTGADITDRLRMVLARAGGHKVRLARIGIDRELIRLAGSGEGFLSLAAEMREAGYAVSAERSSIGAVDATALWLMEIRKSGND